jgi:peptide/nickel transport system permease protein
MVPTLIGITFVALVVMQLAPGDPATLKFQSGGGAGGGVGSSERADIESAIAKFRAEHMLDAPFWKQYLHYVGPFDLSPRGHAWLGGSGEHPWGGLVTGDLKREFHRPSVPIREELWRRLKVTVPLMLVSLLISYLVALPLGIYSVVRQGTRMEASTTVLVFLLYSIPTFWAGLMLQLVFGASWLDLLPILGLHDAAAESMSRGEYLVDLFLHAILPVACLSYGSFAYLSRQMRAGMIETIRQDYIRTARAKGLSERVVVLKHALRNSMIPVLTLFASILPTLIGGSLVVEVIFDIPGMGSYAFEGLLKRDYNVVMATTTLVAVMTLFGILLSDLTYALVDPRIAYD